MSLRSVARAAGPRGQAALTLALVAIVAFGLGRGSVSVGAVRAQASTAGYDVSVASRPDARPITG